MSDGYDVYLYNSKTDKFENKTNQIKKYFLQGKSLKVIFNKNTDNKIYVYSKDKYFFKKPVKSHPFLTYLYRITEERNIFSAEEESILYKIFSDFYNQSISLESALYSFLDPKKLKRYTLNIQSQANFY